MSDSFSGIFATPRKNLQHLQLIPRHGTSIDDVLTRELEDVASAHAEELAAVPGFAMALQWPAVSAS